jgi:hypothetical protein
MGPSTLPANAVKRSLSGLLRPSCAAKIHSVSESKNGGKRSPIAGLNQAMDGSRRSIHQSQGAKKCQLNQRVNDHPKGNAPTTAG